MMNAPDSGRPRWLRPREPVLNEGVDVISLAAAGCRFRPEKPLAGSSARYFILGLDRDRQRQENLFNLTADALQFLQKPPPPLLEELACQLPHRRRSKQ